MTKQKELSILDSTIEALGTASYLGPVFAHLRDYIESEIRSDLEPDIVGLVKNLHAQKETLCQKTKELTTLNSELQQLINDKQNEVEALEKRLRLAKDDIGDLARNLLFISKQKA